MKRNLCHLDGNRKVEYFESEPGQSGSGSAVPDESKPGNFTPGNTRVLVVPGWAGRRRAYDPLLSSLTRRGCHVVMPCLPGSGTSSDLPVAHTLDAYVDWLSDFIASIKFDSPFHVIGHSFGSALAVHFAARNRESVSSLVVLNMLGGGTAGRSRISWIKAFVEELAPPYTRTFQSFWLDGLADLIHHPVSRTRGARLCSSLEIDHQLVAELAGRLPVRAAVGDADKVTPAQPLRELFAEAGVDIEEFTGGHAAALADPERVVAALKSDQGREELDQHGL